MMGPLCKGPQMNYRERDNLGERDSRPQGNKRNALGWAVAAVEKGKMPGSISHNYQKEYVKMLNPVEDKATQDKEIFAQDKQVR